MNVREIIQHRTIERDQRLAALVAKREVKRHPHGGWTIAVTQPGSALAIYEGNHASKATLEQRAKAQTEADIAALKAKHDPKEPTQ
jgi:hypothetical protein